MFTPPRAKRYLRSADDRSMQVFTRADCQKSETMNRKKERLKGKADD